MENSDNKPNTGVDFNQLELGVLEYWNQNKIFEKSLEATKDNKPFVFYDGPPFATGLPHYGHILASVIKDAVGRYQTMNGRYVRRVWGWDCHGLPIENIVEGLLNISGKKQIEEIGVDKYNQACRENVLKFVGDWGKTINRIGRWVDFENSYKTMDTSFMESVWWGLNEFWKKQLIYEDRKVLLYCPRCETPISNFEVAMDNSYRDVSENSVFIKFKLLPRQRIVDDLTDDNTFVLAWTTTPWTLPGNTALHIGEEITYVLVEQNNERYILAKERLEILKGEYQIVKEIKASSLEGLEYEPLFPGVIPNDNGKAFHIYIDDFVTTEDGAGVVHSAVMHGDVDYEAAKVHGLPKYHVLNEKGVYNERAPQFLQGMFFKDAEKPVLDHLATENRVYYVLPYTHSYPFCWRCSTPLYYNAIPAWFINIQKIKPSLIKQNQDEVNWYPEHLKAGRFEKGLENAPDWNISRNRYWATPLPFWKCTNASCNHVSSVGSIAELKQKSVNFGEVYPGEVDLHRPYIDRVILKCDECQSEMKRVIEVVDCWFESGSMPFAELHAPFENRDLFEARKQADFVAEYIAQTRAWFYVMHVVGVGLSGQAPFKNVVTTGTILAEDGSKMSKSKKNYPDPMAVIDRFGVDAIRFYLLSSPVMNGDDLNFSEASVQEVNRKLSLIFYNVWSFLRMSSKERFDTSTLPTSTHVMDKWALNRLAQVTKIVTARFEAYDTVRGCRELIEWVNDLSTWYLRRSRERVKSVQDAQKVLAYLISETARLLAPITPFIAEFIYRDITGRDSVHLDGWPEARDFAISDLHAMDAVREIVSVGHAIRKNKQLSVRQPLPSVAFVFNTQANIQATLTPALEAVILEELNIKKLEQVADIKSSGAAVSGTGETLVREVWIDTVLTPELIAEGLSREIERAVQDLRKKSGLKVGQLVDLYYNTQDEELEQLLLEHIDRKKTFVNQINKSFEVEVDFEIQANIKGKPLWLGMLQI